jgi:UDP-N-acetylglucosamine acyltransferase
MVGEGCVIGPFAVIEAGTRLGPGCRIAAHAVIRSGSELGEQVAVHSFAVVGGPPQDRSFDETTETGVRIGPRCVLREGVTINRATKAGAFTEIGADCYLMAVSHVAHDCQLGEKVILANNVMLAGHISVGAHTFIGGGAGIHQFCRIGSGVMVGGNASLSFDVPPFLMVAERNEIAGLNLVGLRRRGIPREAISELKRCFHLVYDGGGNPKERAAACLAEGIATTEWGRAFLEFFGGGKRGISRPARTRPSEEDV